MQNTNQQLWSLTMPDGDKIIVRANTEPLVQREPRNTTTHIQGEVVTSPTTPLETRLWKIYQAQGHDDDWLRLISLFQPPSNIVAIEIQKLDQNKTPVGERQKLRSPKGEEGSSISLMYPLQLTFDGIESI